MKESKNSIVMTIIILVLILLTVSIFMILKNNNVNNEEISVGLTNEIIPDEETNRITDDIINDNKIVDLEEITQEEKNKIEEYIDVICNRPKYDRLPEFNNISNADKEWIYAHIDKNKYEYATDIEITENLQEVFGKEVIIDVKADQKNIPTDRASNIPKYDDIEKKYSITPYGDMLQFLYTINNIEKDSDGYIVNVIEYCDDLIDENPYKRAVFSFNENNKHKKIFDFEDQQDSKDIKVIEKVMQNKDEFPLYNIKLKNYNDKLIVESIEKI